MFVSYDFTASGAREFSVRAGEAVRVLESHDKGGNPDWSLVEAAQGRRGYVPSNYVERKNSLKKGSLVRNIKDTLGETSRLLSRLFPALRRFLTSNSVLESR